VTEASLPLRSIAIVTAAGSAERFGGRKLLADVDGRPLLDRTIRSLLEGGVSEVIVVVGSDGRAELERDIHALSDPRVRAVENRDPARGMFSSIQEGVRTASGDVVLVLPGDMPFVAPQTVRRVLEEWSKHRGIVSPRYKGKRGHPVALPQRMREEILKTPATANLHQVIKRHLDERTDVDVDDAGIVKDVDTPADLTRAVEGADPLR
jgi:CTP:molybdopterin cytidylyltransferase MocA